MKSRALQFLLVGFVMCMVVVGFGPRKAAEAQTSTGLTTRVSVSSTGEQGNDWSRWPSLSADGRFVAFDSTASNLVPNDTNNESDVFVHDTQSGTTTRVSVSSSGVQGNGSSGWPSISANGRFVTFSSGASNLVVNDTNNKGDVFVHDRQTGETNLVSLSSSGEQANKDSYGPSISADGRFVVFLSDASNLVPNDTNNFRDVFVHDRQTDKTTRVSISSTGTQTNDNITHSPRQNAISADGRFVTFTSNANNLVPNDTNHGYDVFVHDRETGKTTLVSLYSSGVQIPIGSYGYGISADGRVVVFSSEVGRTQIFVRDRQTNITTQVSVSSSGVLGNYDALTATISTDGRHVAFFSQSSTLVPDDTNLWYDVFLHDRQNRTTTLVGDFAPYREEWYGDWSYDLSISADGRFVAFSSDVPNLISNDTNDVGDIFVNDRDYQGVQTHSISGRVFDSLTSQPVVNVTVSTAGGLSAATNSSGFYTIENVPAGSHVLSPVTPGYSSTPPQRNITVSANVPDIDFFVLDQTAQQGDEDTDGIDDGIEAAGPNDGDGNFDGIPDSEQSNVATLINSQTGSYITVASPETATLKNVAAVANPDPTSSPEDMVFPLGLLSFEAEGLSSDGKLQVELFLEGGIPDGATYYKYGPTAENPVDHWYEFMYDASSKTGAEILSDRLVLHFVDGARGDGDLQVDGVILDPGAVAHTNSAPDAPSNPNPTDGAIDVLLSDDLGWSATDPDNDPLTYEVHFGTDNPPPQVIAGQSLTTYDPPGELAYATTYYWQIVASDGHGGSTSGPVWSFTTEPESSGFTLISVSSEDTQGEESSWGGVVSDDGRFVVFASDAGNLISYDTNGRSDVFIRDRREGTTSIVSVSSNGVIGNNHSSDAYLPGLSGDGRYVVFESDASNLVNGDTNGFTDIFVRDRVSSTTQRISVSSIGAQANGGSNEASISADGRYVTFTSAASNLVPNDTNGQPDIFIHDLQTGTTSRVSIGIGGTQGNDGSLLPRISADGSYVVFGSMASNLVPNDTNGVVDIFIHDRQNGTTSIVSVSSNGDQSNLGSLWADVSADGRLVTFLSVATNLVSDDTALCYDPFDDLYSNCPDIFVRDRQSGTTELVSVSSAGEQGNEGAWGIPSISDDGRVIVFSSTSSNLAPNDSNNASDVFVHDRGTGLTTLISLTADGTAANGRSESFSISSDGRFVAVDSYASNLVPKDTNIRADVFLYYRKVTQTPNQPPNSPANPGPANGATDVATNTALSWQATDPDNDPLIYEVHFGTTNPPPQVIVSQSESTYDPPGDLANATTYYWQIIASDGRGGETAGPVWSFTTADTLNVIQFEPIADAYVDEASKAKNFGTKAFLRVKDTAKDSRAYLTFDVNGLSCAVIESVSLLLFAQDPASDGGTVYRVDSNWTEKGIKWNNAPSLTGGELGSFGAVADEAWATVTLAADAVTGDGVYSFAIAGGSADLVEYASREGENPPTLQITYRVPPPAAPVADFSGTPVSGFAPLEVSFSDTSTNCPTFWEWDFGDGTTSSEQHPVHTYAAPGTYEVSLTAGNGAGSDTVTRTNYITVEAAPFPNLFYISPANNKTIGGMKTTSADILRYNKAADSWTMIYDGSERGTLKNVSAFHIMDDGSLLLVFSANQPIAGLGTASPYDVVKFTPNNPNSFPLGTGSFSWFFQGKPNGLSTGAEKIDALDYVGNRLLISTTGAANVTLQNGTALKPTKEDVFAFNRSTNQWESALVIDGSNIPELKGKNISSVWDDPSSGDYYVTVAGSFNIGGVKGNAKSIVKLSPSGNSFTPVVVDWLAPGVKFPSNLDGLDIGQ